ncbi:Vacuolar sorting-associated 41 [Lecanosticta acicola]|uniref:Vacuolar sorting-associated 41 n=1 Tax=Lecanosticta acicola TaxID=111012 RepID=A0AAI9E9T7_9PEZI|nr:Vacuolar sorting-associated 41 [Lecanosticta acicola]
MSADVQATETDESERRRPGDAPVESAGATAANDEPEDDDDEEEQEEEDEEPKLKYAKLTGTLANVYRNGDSTSAFTVLGDKMVVGTHSGSIHVMAVPTLESLRTYRAHSASVTSVSISPTPPSPALVRNETGSASLINPPASAKNVPAPTSRANPNSPRTPQRSQQPPVPNTPNNHVYIATSSLDGHVCISSLINAEDVQLRNFARPVNAVALSPEYKSDRTYLSGGLAGNLVLTVGGKTGVSTDANTNSAAAAASGWLSTFGMGGNTGKDRNLHSGEGAISSIKWSLSGKWVVWVNEEGIKIMRSHLKLGSENQEDEWRRIAHAARPNRKGWEEMAGVWKGRCEWVDERRLESDDLLTGGGRSANGINGSDPVKSPPSSRKGKKRIEKLLVGWGDTAWVLHVQEGSSTAQGPNAKRQVGSADIIHKLQFRDCIISGISFYTPSLLAILAYRTRDDDDQPIVTSSTGGAQDTPSRKGRQHRHTSLAPQLRIVNVVSGEEVELDELSRISRYETLSSQDYHLSSLYMPPPLPEKASEEQTRDKLKGLWDASVAATISGGGYATRMFSSSASVFSGSSGGKETNGRTHSFQSQRQGSTLDVTATPEAKRKPVDAHPYAIEPGLKLFIQSPYDCVLAVKRELSDHLEWLLEHQRYGDAWQLIDDHPEAVDTSSADLQSFSSHPSSPSKDPGGGTLADFFADETSSDATGRAALRAHNSAAQREKRRIGDMWLQQLVSADEWAEAGRVAGKVLGTSSRWEHWVWTFAQADKFDEITPYIPSTELKPPLPSQVYEVILGHYIWRDRQRLSKLLDEWDPELFDVKSVISAIEERLQSGEVPENAVEDGVRGRDWRVLMEALARLYLADGRVRDSLRCYIRLQDAEKAFSLVREEKLLDVVADDVPGLLMLRVSKEQMRSASLSELEEATSEAVQLLVEEAYRGTVPTISVIRQLASKGDSFQPFLFFYLRALWNSNDRGAQTSFVLRHSKFDRQDSNEGHAMVEDHADLAVQLFAEYDRDLLLTFLKSSELYSYDKAAEICKERHYIPELVHVLSKTGQTEKALWLIIDELGDVSQAIAFTKQYPDLWENLLEYSMNKPSFIRGLLEEVGAAAAFNPIDVVRRIPEGLQIEGLKQGVQHLVREFEIQMSISGGVAKVLRSEVAMGMDTLRAGRRKGVRFEVVHENSRDVDLAVRDPPTKLEGQEELPMPSKRRPSKVEAKKVQPGHCVGCEEVFHEQEKETLIGFACGHVYHLSCLLNANPETQLDSSKEAEQLVEQLTVDDNDPGAGYSGRSVGGKVAHAHMIQNIIKGGCQHCVVPEGA